ncbi:NAD(P)/FAD-dependent oxidoreductase [Actinomycetota bacterium]
MSTLAVIGASLAGLSAARAARAQGFDGRIYLIGDEEHRPYDRPPLSKQFLDGTMTAGDLSLEDPDEDLDVEWILGSRALELDCSDRCVWLHGGRRVEADHLLIATGARARQLPLGGVELEGVHTLRTLDDAIALKEAIVPGVRLVVLGAGFIGAEVAATAKKLGADVTVLEVAAVPLAGPLGVTMGAVIGSLHEKHGVRLRTSTSVARIVGQERVTGVELASGETIAADVVVVGVGALPNVEWLAGSALEIGNGVVCNEVGATNVPQIAAVGDCASWYDPIGGQRRIEHWQGALERPAIAVAHLLGTGATVGPAAPPYFWSDQYDARIQFVGASADADDVTYEVGGPDSDSFLAVYRVKGEPIGALGLSCPRDFTRFRRQFAKDAAARRA